MYTSDAFYTDGNRSVIRGTSPTLYFRDTNARSGMIYVNSNRMYFLSGGNDSEAWGQAANNRWPLYLQTDTNKAVFGGDIDASVGTVTVSQFQAGTNTSRDKFRVYPTSQYCIGMQSGVTFGDLNDWAMTFQMNSDNDRGFWWGDDGHNTSQGAMSLSTRGWLSVAERILVGEGQSSTGSASHPLDVRGKTRLYESTGSSPSTTEGTLILQHGNSGGTSSIVFPSAVNRGSDYRYISCSDSNYSGGERARLRIGTSNDGDDDIILQPTGDVGINNDNPEEKLHVTGNIKASGRVTANDADVQTILTNGYSCVSMTSREC